MFITSRARVRFQFSIWASVASGIFSRIFFTPSSGVMRKSERMRCMMVRSESMRTASALRTCLGSDFINFSARANSPCAIYWSTWACQSGLPATGVSDNTLTANANNCFLPLIIPMLLVLTSKFTPII